MNRWIWVFWSCQDAQVSSSSTATAAGPSRCCSVVPCDSRYPCENPRHSQTDRMVEGEEKEREREREGEGERERERERESERDSFVEVALTRFVRVSQSFSKPSTAR